MKMNKEVVMVRLTDIIPNRFQPRLAFDEEALNELADSIKQHGIIQPLILRDLGNKYEIIAGERRYKAATIAGLTEVPAIVGSMDDQTSAILALIENIQRKDLSAIEEAKSYQKIQEMGSMTQEELAKRMGKAQSTVANKMRLLSLTNEVQMALMNNLISERHARCLLQIKDEDKQKEVLNKIISERMNVRDTDDYIKNVLGINKDVSPVKSEPSVDTPTASTEGLSNNNEVTPIPLVVPSAEEVKEEIPNPVELEVNMPFSKVEEVKVGEPQSPAPGKPENPNVYAQSNNVDFVDITSLNDAKGSDLPNQPVEAPVPDSELPPKVDIPVVELPNIDNFTSLNEEEKLSDNENNNSAESSLLKIKLATAIKVVNDSVEEMKKLGYNAEVQEIDNPQEYQIIIKVNK